MDLYERIQNSIDFIDANLTNDILLDEVANKAYCSLSYFHNIFHAIVGVSIKEYIRKRRLAVAAFELLTTNNRILDIALKYQYESNESFTRAFTKMFGVTPSLYRKNKICKVFYQKVNLYQLKLKHCERGYNMKPRIIEKDDIKVVGIEINTSFDEENFSNLIKNLWNDYLGNNVDKKIPNQLHPNVTLGINMNFDSNGTFTYFIGKEISDFSTIPEGMVSYIIPSTKYAIFTAKGNTKSELGFKLGEVWNYFFETWLPSSGYTQAGLCAPNSLSAYNEEASPNFELYDERFTNDVFEVDVYIPIKE